MIRRIFRHLVRRAIAPVRAWRNRPQIERQAAQKIAQRLDTIRRGLL